MKGKLEAFYIKNKGDDCWYDPLEKAYYIEIESKLNKKTTHVS